MKKILFTVLLLPAIMQGNAQNENKMEKQKIETIIHDFTAAVDAGNANAAANYLDQHFRVVLNNYNNSGATVILSREQYIGMMQEGKVGGNKRKTTFLLTDVHENAALVKVVLAGEKNTFTNYYSLIKRNEQWLIVNDIPQIVPSAKN